MEDTPLKLPRDLRPLLVQFVEQGELTEGLYDACYHASLRLVDMGRDEEDQDAAAKDLALDFLINCVRPNGLVDLRTVAGLRREMARFHTRRESPERKELWGVLSEAIRTLAERGKAVRLDANWKAINSNTALWAAPDVEANAVLDVETFRKAADKIGAFSPRNESSRIITPSTAMTLIERLLKAAKAPIPFEMINEEAARHVVFRMQHQEELDQRGEDGDLISTHAIEYRYDVALWLEEEAIDRSASIWAKTSELDQGQTVLCRYFLPKHFLNLDVTLQSIGGDFRRHSERSRVIRELFAGSMALQRLGTELDKSLGVAFSEALLTLTGLVARRLMRKCSEIFPDLDFDLPEPVVSGGDTHE